MAHFSITPLKGEVRGYNLTGEITTKLAMVPCTHHLGIVSQNLQQKIEALFDPDASHTLQGILRKCGRAASSGQTISAILLFPYEHS